jgi:ATP-binding cassette subfamily B protein
MRPALTALRSLFLLAMHHGCHLTPDQIAQAQIGDLTQGMMDVLREAGFETSALRRVQWDDLTKLGSAFPVLAALQSGGWLIVAGVLGTGRDAQLAVLDPAREQLGITLMAETKFLPAWTGTVLLCRKPAPAAATEPRFGAMAASCATSPSPPFPAA